MVDLPDSPAPNNSNLTSLADDDNDNGDDEEGDVVVVRQSISPLVLLLLPPTPSFEFLSIWRDLLIANLFCMPSIVD